MTLERYLAVVYPFFHENFVTKSRLLAIFVLMQLPFGIPYFAFLNQTLETYIEAYLLVLIGAVFSVMYFLNYKIFSTVETLRQRVAITLGTYDCEEEYVNVKKHNFSLGKVSTCLLAVVCLSVCYFPTVVICVLKLTRVLDRNDEDNNRTLIVIRLWEDTFLTMNSTLNYLIFFYKNSALRRRGIEIMGKCLCARFRYHK
ncbi:beta-2 adrenergic receptor-like [Paramuricea clavata]|uniref:Beta-2 adrenergic receptor-like n=1 Tax=Paramuricea clavata TaxID=317549 RepID=A0A6S7G829_PARCT|nr:beta-2 adrenergic receptor-like [Paramuricea clavata]